MCVGPQQISEESSRQGGPPMVTSVQPSELQMLVAEVAKAVLLW